MRILTMSCFVIFLLSKAVWASDKGQFTFGIAGMNSSNIYAGASNKTRVLPDLRYSKGTFAIGLKEGVTYHFSQKKDKA